MTLAVPTAIYPVAERFIGIAKEATTGTPPTSGYVEIPVTGFNPDPKLGLLEDKGLRGAMTSTYDLQLGSYWTEVAIPTSPLFGDTIGHILLNVFGDYTATGTAGTPTWVASGAISAGAGPIAVTSGSSAVAGTYIQIGTTTTAEIVKVGTGSTATSIVVDATTPIRFSHLTGITITTVTAPFCVDEETEILTEDGWKTVHDLSAGDVVLTYNHATGMSEWQPALEVCVFPAERRELIWMEGAGHSSLTTPNHRWPVVDYRGARRWSTTETLTVHDRIPAGAFCADLPREAKYDDAFVELVAWFWTEGTIRKNDKSPNCAQVVICQSQKNAENVARIDAALRAVIGPPLDNIGQRHPEPRWRRKPDGPNVRFIVNAAAGRTLAEVAPDRVVRREFLRTLTQAQLDLFIKISMLADNSGPTRLHQTSRDRVEAFQFAATLAGHPTSLIERKLKGRYEGKSMWGVTLQRRRYINPGAARSMAKRHGGGWKTERVMHDGIVWCPRTDNMTWYARRNGRCYFTGNTHVFNTLNPASATGLVNGQPPSHALFDRNQTAGSAGHYGDLYPFACFSSLKISGAATGLLQWEANLTCWPQTAPSGAITPTLSSVDSIPAWMGTSTIGGTGIYDIMDWEINLVREVEPIPAVDGQQAPYVIARGPLDGTFTINYAPAVDQSALNNYLNNVRPTLVWTTSNGLSGSSLVSFSMSAQIGAFNSAKLTAAKTLFGYDTTGILLGNTVNVGNSGGWGICTITLQNAVATY